MLHLYTRYLVAISHLCASALTMILLADLASKGQVQLFACQGMHSAMAYFALSTDPPAPATCTVAATPCVALVASPVSPPRPVPFSPAPWHTDSPAPVPTPVVNFSSPSLPADKVSLPALAALVLAALVISHSFTVLARLRMHRAAQWHKSHLLALKARQQHSMIQREVAEYAAEIALEPVSRRRCTVAQVAAILEAARLRGTLEAGPPEIPPKSALRPKDLPVPLLPRSNKRRSRCTQAAKRKPNWLEVIAEEV